MLSSCMGSAFQHNTDLRSVQHRKKGSQGKAERKEIVCSASVTLFSYNACVIGTAGGICNAAEGSPQGNAECDI